MAHRFECVSSFFREKGDLDLDSRATKQNGDTEEEEKKSKRNKNEGEERAENPWEAPGSSLLPSFPLFLFRVLSSAPSTCGYYKNRYM